MGLVIFVYLLDILSALQAISVVTLIVMITFICIYLLIYKIESYGHDDFIKNVSPLLNLFKQKLVATITVLMFMFAFLVPSKQTMLIMGGVWYGQIAVEQVTSSPLFKKSMKLLEERIDFLLEENKEDK